MKILKIRIHNLNSLRGENVIDFQQEPLAGTGIFAITGPTGAGKSTILDALTLALYGRAARYGGEPNPCDMMCRQTGECAAEVELEVKDGRFRALWQLRRARGKPDGNVQPVVRHIYDAHGNALAQQVRQADALIEKLTGLDFDRFLRSVLLAQGDFARFLKANDNERAALLERLTGSVIYSELGRLAFREAELRQQKLAMQRSALEQIELLSDEEIATRQAAIQQLTAEARAYTAQQQQIAKRLNDGRQLAERLRLQQEARQEGVTLVERRAAAASDLGGLERHLSAQPFLPDLATLDQLLKQEELTRNRLRELQTELEIARRELTAGRAAAQGCAEAEKQLLTEKLATVQQQLAVANQKRSAAAEWLERHAHDRGLDAAMTGIVSHLTLLTTHRAQLAEIEKRILKLDDDEKRATALLQKRTKVLQETSSTLTKLREEHSLAAAALKKLIEEHPEQQLQKEMERLRKEKEDLVRAEGSLKILAEAGGQLQKLEQDVQKRTGELDKAAAARAIAQKDLEHQTELVAEAEETRNALQVVASLTEHRASLRPGEECPLCGAIEHPYAGGDPSSRLDEAAKRVETRRTRERELRLLLEERQKAEVTLRATLQGLKEQRTSVRKRIEQTQTDLRGFAAPAGSPEECGAALKLNQEALAAAAAVQASIVCTKEKAGEAQKLVLNQEKVAEKLQAEVQATNEALARLRSDRAEAQKQADNSRQELAKVSQLLAELLAPIKMEAPDPGEESAARQELEMRQRTYAAQSAELTSCAQQIKDLSAAARELGLTIKSLQQQLEELLNLHQDSDLPGEAAPGQALRFRKEWGSFTRAKGELPLLHQRLSAACTGIGEATRAAADTRKSVQQSAEALQRRLQGSPFADVAALRAGHLPPEEARRREQLKNMLEHDANQLAGKLQQLDGDIADLRERSAPEGELLTQLEQEHQTLGERLTHVTTQGANIRGELKRDSENRERHLQATRHLQQQQQELAVWLRLRELIGSAEGDKFNKFAQGLSLQVLLQHANRHLERLNDRYRLGRVPQAALELQIQDLHQAGVTRPMQSLSGGETFLASLALALGLSDLAGRNVRIDSLFIDEGFGSLDAETMETAVAALESLRMRNKIVGIISHVDLLKERIATQISVEKGPGGISTLKIK